MVAAYKLILVGLALTSAPTVHALESSALARNEIVNLDALSRKMDSASAAMTAAYNALRASLEARIGAAESRITATENNNTSQYNTLSNHESRIVLLEQRMSAMGNGAWNSGHFNSMWSRIAALEARPAAKSMVLNGTVGAGGGSASGWVAAHYCALSYINIGTTSDNHGHSCQVERYPNNQAYRIISYKNKGDTTCYMDCFSYQ